MGTEQQIAFQVGLCTGGTVDVYTDGCVDVSAVQPETLARGLAHVTRFGGQAGAFSVGEHSVNMCRLLLAQGAPVGIHELRACLIHDAPECLGVGDTQRFVKRAYQSPGLTEFDRRLTEALWSHLNPGAGPWSLYAAGVKNTDRAIGSIEAQAFGFPFDPAELPHFEHSRGPGLPRRDRPERVAMDWLYVWETGSLP